MKPVTLYEDNQPAIHITNGSAAEGRTKHIDARYHYIREKIADGTILVRWISTNEQVADGFTKPLDRFKHERFVQQLNMVDCSLATSTSNITC